MRDGVTYSRSFTALADTRGGGVLFAAGTIFALGLVTGLTIRPSPAPAIAPPTRSPATAAHDAASTAPIAQRLDGGLAYPADVLRIIDGDTFEARVRVWPGLDVDTKVRLRGIDAPELHARCSDEHAKAEAARAALETILAEGGIAISRVGVDKYGGRVDALVATRNTADVSAALLSGGWARSYGGGKRGSWCG
jgi:endonuclease YncB( thermonuclease family)